MRKDEGIPVLLALVCRMSFLVIFGSGKSKVATHQKNGRILLANLLQSSSSTFSCVSFPRFFAFQESMWDAPISALLNSPTVSGRFSCFRIPH
jgi:hypothetical protein